MPHPRRTSLALMSFLLAAAVSDVRLPSFAGPDDQGDAWKQMLGYLRIMSTGEPAQKRSFAGEASRRLLPLFGPHDGHDEEDVQVIFDEVRDLLRVEADDFVTWTMLNDLSFRDDGRLEPLFLDALRDVSPNLKWSGIKWFSGNTCSEAVPDLESAWRHEERPWVRRDLIAALARQGRSDHLEEFISIARGKDPDLAEAAIEALSGLKDSRTLPVIVSLARNGAGARRQTAIESLASWSDSVDALEALLLGSRSDDPSLKASAVVSLGSFRAPGASERLEQLALEDGDPWLRSRALEALGKADPARAIPLLIQGLHQATSEDRIQLKTTAVRTLMGIDDPTTLDSASDLAPA